MKIFMQKKLKPLLTRLFLVLCCAFSIYSCALSYDVDASIKKINSGIDSTSHMIDRANYSHSKIVTSTNVNQIYIGDEVTKIADTRFLPKIFSDPIQLSGNFYSLHSIADILNRLTKYPVLVDSNIKANDFDVNINQNSGNLLDLLNNISAKADIAWQFTDGKIILADTVTKTWFLHALPGSMQVQNQINSNNGISGQSNGSGASTGGMMGGGASGMMATAQSQSNANQNTVQNVQFNIDNSFWDNIQKAVRGMLSRNGKSSIMPSTSSITVTDKPSVILRISQFIKLQNNMLSRQVQIDVQVLSVETNRSDNYGINWNLALQSKKGMFSINGQNPAADSGATGSGLNPVFVPTATTQSFTFGATGGDMNGSQMIIDALSAVNKASLITSTAATTLNDQPVPVQVVEQQSFVSNVTSMMVPFSGNQSGLTTGQLSYGFVLNILPDIEDSGIINLQMSINLSSLKALNTFGSPGSMVELPDMLQRNTMQKVKMRSGDTYVLTGFDSEFNQLSNSGVGNTNNFLLGGGTSSQKTRTRLVILVTPRIVNL